MESAQRSKSARSRQAIADASNIGHAERWASIAGGGLAILMGLRRSGVAGLAMSAVGGLLVYRGATGRSMLYERLGVTTARPGEGRLLGAGGEPVHLHAAITINRPAAELYRFWRQFSQLPRIMPFLEDVSEREGKRSHWVARLPSGGTLEWDSEVTDEQENRRLAWRSTEPAELPNWGEIRFVPAPAGRGTEVQLELHYQPPGGAAGRAIGRFLQGLSGEVVQEDLRRFKRLMETGEISTNNTTVH